MSQLVVPPNIIGSSVADAIEASTSAFNSVALQVDADGIVDTRAGDDTVFAYADGDTSYGINNDGYIGLGSGNDGLNATGSFTGLQVNGCLDAGGGSDNIRGGAYSSGFMHNALGIGVQGQLSTGSGNDALLGEAYGAIPGSVSEGLMVLGTLSAGSGDDNVSGFGFNEQGSGIGIRTAETGSIRAGAGDDSVFGFGTESGIAGNICGGSGNDHFVARRIDAFDQELADQGGAADGLIAGDQGDDVFDVGYGNATLDGGPGIDTLMLRGECSDYIIKNNCNDGATILRDGYTMTARNFEAIEFYNDSAPNFETSDFLSEAMLR